MNKTEKRARNWLIGLGYSPEDIVFRSTKSPAGYFIVSSLDEAIDYMRVLKGRLVHDAYRRRDFKLASREILQPHQMALI